VPNSPTPTPVEIKPNPLIEWCAQAANSKTPLCRNVRLWCCLRFWQWIKRQHGNWGSSVRHYHPALTRRTAWPLGRNDIQRQVWRVIGRILRLHRRNEGYEQESSYEAGHPCLRSSSNVVDTGPTLGEGDDVNGNSLHDQTPPRVQ
jgi:hypothetical protein